MHECKVDILRLGIILCIIWYERQALFEFIFESVRKRIDIFSLKELQCLGEHLVGEQPRDKSALEVIRMDSSRPGNSKVWKK